MTRDRKAQVATVLVLLGALGIGLARSKTWRFAKGAVGDGPEDAVYAMLANARTGDIGAYLASYTEPMESALRQVKADTTDAGFAKYLKDSVATVKGVAVYDPQPISDQETKVRVEYIYQDRNEAQVLYLRKSAGVWKIFRADSDERVKTLIPYGTPVR